MRISTLQQYSINVERMQNSQTTIGELQRQISTGKKYHQPSDAPAVAATAIRLERDIAALDRYDGNIKIATNRLELEEVMLKDMNTEMDRMREKVLSIDATENDENLKVIAEEIRQIVASIAGGMNKKDAQGEYIFSGSKGFTQPYVLNSNGRWEYQGDNGQRDIQIGATHYVASSDSGQYLFETVPGDVQYTHSGANNFKPTAPQMTFDSDAEKKQFEDYLKKEVKGDLKFRTFPSGAVAGSQYTFQLVDTAGKVHHSENITFPLTAATAVEFKGAKFQPTEPVSADYSFPVTSSTMGDVQSVSIADNAAMDKFFEDYGDVRLDLTNGTADTYQLVSSKTGQPISIKGEDTFNIPASGVIEIGGLKVNVNSPLTLTGTTAFDLKAPSENHTVTSTTTVKDVKVSSASDYADFQRKAMVASKTAITVTIDPAGPTYSADVIPAGAPAVAPALGAVALTGAGTAANPHKLTVEGIEFTVGDINKAQTFTVELQKTPATPGNPGEQIAGPASTVKVDYEKKNILNIGLELAEKLEKGRATPELKEELKTLLADTIDDITLAQDKLNTGLTGVGARLASLEETETANLDIKLFTKTTLSGIQDADLAEVATKFKLEQTLLQASQQTFATVSRITLFEYIR